MPNPSLQKIIKLTQTQYDILAAGGTVGAYTGLNDNYLYLIQDDKDYLPYAYWSSDHGVDNLPFGVTSSQATQTGQYGNNHSVFMYFNQVGTPFQLQIPDSSESYIYKRYYSGGSWSAWSKVSAGFADSAGDADTVDGRDADEFYLATNPEGYTSNQGTVTSVGAGTGLLISGTSTVNPTVNIASGYKLPTTTEWNGLATESWVGEHLIPSKQIDGTVPSGYTTQYFADGIKFVGAASPAVTVSLRFPFYTTTGEHTIATQDWVTGNYWADVNISASSNKGTTPTFSTVTIGGSGSTAGKATMQYNANEDCIDFVFA